MLRRSFLGSLALALVGGVGARSKALAGTPARPAAPRIDLNVTLSDINFWFERDAGRGLTSSLVWTGGVLALRRGWDVRVIPIAPGRASLAEGYSYIFWQPGQNQLQVRDRFNPSDDEITIGCAGSDYGMHLTVGGTRINGRPA